MSRLCYVTGVPAVGKSTVSNGLEQSFPDRYVHMGFGGILLDALRENGTTKSERDLRLDPGGIVTRALIDQATTILQRRVADAKTAWTLIDSHAASLTREGYVATPDGNSFFRQLRYSAVVHLIDDPEAVLARSDTQNSGRLARTKRDVEWHSSLLVPISILYASYSSCPAFFVDVAGGAELAITIVDQLLRGLEDV
jgi:adenylate kinase